MRSTTVIGLCCIIAFSAVAMGATQPAAREISFDDSWGAAGFTVTSSGDASLTLVYSLPSVSLNPVTVRGEAFSQVAIPGSFLPTNPGEPNLPGSGRFLAVPSGATVSVEVLESRIQTLTGINVLPSARIPLETEKLMPEPQKDLSIYQHDALWPSEPVQLSEPMKIRGVGGRVLGITPFAYNPVSGELRVFTDIRIRLTFEGGAGLFGDERLRSRYWDPILERQLLNFDRLSAVDYSSRDYSGRDGVEYIIIVPDDPDFISWGQTIADFRILQGISSQVFTVTEVGGNYPAAIEDFIDNAYEFWGTAPVAVLLLGDYVPPGQPGGGDQSGERLLHHRQHLRRRGRR